MFLFLLFPLKPATVPYQLLTLKIFSPHLTCHKFTSETAVSWHTFSSIKEYNCYFWQQYPQSFNISGHFKSFDNPVVKNYEKRHVKTNKQTWFQVLWQSIGGTLVITNIVHFWKYSQNFKIKLNMSFWDQIKNIILRIKLKCGDWSFGLKLNL